MRNKRLIAALIAGFLLGTFWLLAVRFIAVKDDSVHYHANFAVYINGQREEFKSPLFYEEVQSCSDSEVAKPQTRVHMHDQENSIVHVHDHAATWGHFLSNLGFGLTDKSIMDDKNQTFVDGQDGNALTFILNGEEVTNVANRVVNDEDVLLINYGSEDDDAIKQRAEAIPTDAHKYNDELDPAGCSGSEPLTFTNRLKKAFGL